MTTASPYWLLMPAAGRGARFGGATPKQHLPLAGATVLELSLAPFLRDARCRAIVLALSPDDQGAVPLLARLPSRVRRVDGGAERADSVLAALDSLAGEVAGDDWMLVHDAVRPCLADEDLAALLEAGAASADGALLAAPLADTLKRADATARVADTPSREGLWRALTPQMFRHHALRAALRAARTAGRLPTDESQAIEWAGGRPMLVAARHSNIKITTADDLPLAAAILGSRRGGTP